MAQGIRVVYTLGPGELLALTPALNRGTMFSNLSGLTFLAFAVLGLFEGNLFTVLIAGILGLALLSGFYCLPFSALGLLLSRHRPTQPVALSANEQGIDLELASGWNHLDWTEIRRARSVNACFLLYARYPRALAIPKSAFDPDALIAFQGLLLAKGKMRSSN